MWRSSLLASLVFSLTVVGAASGARGVVYVTSLDALLPGGANAGGAVIGSQRYSQFAFRNESSFDLRPADVSVRITGSELSPGQLTIQFSFGVDAAAGQGGSVSIDYRTDDLESFVPMNRVGLRFNGSVPAQGVGPGSAFVNLAVSTVDGSDLTGALPVSDTAMLGIFNDGPGRLEDFNSAATFVNPTLALRLSNQFSLSASGAGRL